MPEKRTIKRAQKDRRQGKAPSTQAGEFVREEMEHIRQGKHGARSTKQAIAIGLSKARRAGVGLPAPKKGSTSERTRRNAERASEAGRENGRHKTNPKRSRAVSGVLRREGTSAASHGALAEQARQQARKRGSKARHAAAKKGAQTRLAHQSHAERSRIARKAAGTRKQRRR
jgi:hypothetical protein